MKTFYTCCFLCLLLVSCNSEPTLQKFFVENSENKDFLVMDVSSNILNVDEKKLSDNQATALKSFEKMNVLAFKLTDKNKNQFDIQRTKVDAILKNKKYQQLMKYTSGKDGASLSFVGADDHIEEFVFFVKKKEAGFAIVRVIGKDMDATNIMTLMQVIKKSNIDMGQLKPLQQLMN